MEKSTKKADETVQKLEEEHKPKKSKEQILKEKKQKALDEDVESVQLMVEE
jgi:hypothetical protein